MWTLTYLYLKQPSLAVAPSSVPSGTMDRLSLRSTAEDHDFRWADLWIATADMIPRSLRGHCAATRQPGGDPNSNHSSRPVVHARDAQQIADAHSSIRSTKPDQTVAYERLEV
jgi:hypothetical protein